MLIIQVVESQYKQYSTWAHECSCLSYHFRLSIFMQLIYSSGRLIESNHQQHHSCAFINPRSFRNRDLERSRIRIVEYALAAAYRLAFVSFHSTVITFNMKYCICVVTRSGSTYTTERLLAFLTSNSRPDIHPPTIEYWSTRDICIKIHRHQLRRCATFFKCEKTCGAY